MTEDANDIAREHGIEGLRAALDNAVVVGPAKPGESEAIFEYFFDDDEPIPPREWLLGNVFCKTFLSSLLAGGGTGKTALRVAQLLALASGKEITGEHVFRRCKALLILLEDDRNELKRRIRAARLHYNINADEIRGWLHLVTVSARDGKLMLLDEKGRPVPGELAATLRATVKRLEIDVACLDPFVKAHGLDENSNNAIDAVMQVLSDIATDCNAAIDLPHHINKVGAEAGNADRGRGASAMKDAGRLVYTLTKMTTEEAKAFSIEEAERWQFIRVDSAKVNLSPAGSAQWFKLVGVDLGNHTVAYPSGDNVQTVEPWTPPATWEGLSTSLLNRILDEISAGVLDKNGEPTRERYSGSPSAKKRGAFLVVLKNAPEKSEAQAREVIKTWVKNGLLVSKDYEDPVQRKDLTGLYVDDSKRPGREC